MTDTWYLTHKKTPTGRWRCWRTSGCNRSTQRSRSYETASPWNPTVVLCIGPYGGLRGRVRHPVTECLSLNNSFFVNINLCYQRQVALLADKRLQPLDSALSLLVTVAAHADCEGLQVSNPTPSKPLGPYSFPIVGSYGMNARGSRVRNKLFRVAYDLYVVYR